MKAFFQRLVGGKPSAKDGTIRLAAFGKHPGWDDHIPGIGVDTTELANLKQVLYVRGIGGQIDSGSWEKLEPEKRQEGFDHTFLWLSEDHPVLGQFWSSTDRKGRTKYPMLLCAQGDAFTPASLFAAASAELQQLRRACQVAPSAEQVVNECRASQNRLDAQRGEPPPPDLGTALSLDARRRFLESRELGPDRVGLLRILHELTNAAGTQDKSSRASANDLRPRHIRVPLCADSVTNAVLLWADFLRCVVPPSVPLVLIARANVHWMDVLIGEPLSDDFFCLQASPKALPLATEIPYELAPELNARAQEFETRFLALVPGGADRIPSAVTSAPQANQPPPARSAGRNSALLLAGGAILLVGGAAIWFVGNQHASRKSAAVTPSIATPINPIPGQPAARARPLAVATNQSNPGGIDQNQQQLQRFQDLLAAGKKAFNEKNYVLAEEKLKSALAILPGDANAADLLRHSQEQQKLLQTEAEFARSITDSKQALDQKQFETAQKQIQKALALKPEDSGALEISARIAQQQQSARMEGMSNTLRAAQIALASGKYDQAIQLAGQSLQIAPGRADAKQVLDQARQAKQSDAAYHAALAATENAFNKGDFAAALAQANRALEFKSADPAAQRWASRSQDEISRLAKLQEERKVAAAKLEETPKVANDSVAAAAVSVSSPESPRATPVSARTVGDPVVPSSPAGDMEKYDMLLRNLLIELHVKPQGKSILTNGGTAAPLPGGILSQPAIERYFKAVDSLRAAYKELQTLDAERKQDLEKLRSAILYWNP